MGWARRLSLLPLVFACGPAPGEDDSEILLPFEALRGGVIFASQAFVGTKGYDLYWAPVPASPSSAGQPVLKLTEAPGHEWQPSVSAGGQGIAFARRGDGIHVITPSGRVKRVSDTRDTRFFDSLPAISPDGSRIAWVREDTSKPVGDGTFHETVIMLANFDGTEARALQPRPGVVQDAPVFAPQLRSTRVAWSEFNAENLTAVGPSSYGVWVHDFMTNTGYHLCRGDPPLRVGEDFWRCFGQHMAWPIENALVLTQSFFELYLDGSEPTSSYGTLLGSLATQQLGQPVRAGPQGFFHAFPLSASYLGLQRMLVEGLVTSVDGDQPSSAFFIASVDGAEVWRLHLEGFREYDPINTAGYLFSVATPQLVP